MPSFQSAERHLCIRSYNQMFICSLSRNPLLAMDKIPNELSGAYLKGTDQSLRFPDAVHDYEMTDTALGDLIPSVMTLLGSDAYNIKVDYVHPAMSLRTPLPAVFLAAILKEFLLAQQKQAFVSCQCITSFEHRASEYFMISSSTLQKSEPTHIIKGAEDLIWYNLLYAESSAQFALLVSMVSNCRGMVVLGDHHQLKSIALPCSMALQLNHYPTSFVQQVTDLAQTNLADPGFGVDQLAEILNISRVTLFRRLKAEAGMSPHDFLFDHKLRAAWQLITRTRTPISAMHELVGFSSDSYFHQAFKRKYFVHPVAVRKAYVAMLRR
jgi:AraC-like DNA-binding protein